MTNLEDYVSLVADTTVHAGISRQVEAFRSGFNQVCTIMTWLFSTRRTLTKLPQCLLILV